VPDLDRPDPVSGVFETMLVTRGAPVELERHLARLRSSLRVLYAAELPAAAHELALARAAPLALGRLRITATPAGAGEAALEAVVAEVDARDVFPSWSRAVALRSVAIEGGLGAHKWADRRWLGRIESGLPEGCLALLCDLSGEVLECSRANVFVVEGETLLTPPADRRILPGVARARAIELARALGMDVREETLAMERLVEAEGVLLTGSVRGIEPVRAVDEATFKAPSEIVRALAAEMRRAWMAEPEC
jgi:para-aminobenzoate synthetase/4-amino-4-deoxychorismate lyase